MTHEHESQEPPLDERPTAEQRIEDGEQEPRDWAGILVGFIAVGIAVVGLLSIFSYANTNRDLATNAEDISKETRRAQREECVRVEIVKAALRGVVAGTVPSAERGPGASYYREHPDELKAAKEGARKTIKAFAIQQCPGLSREQLNRVLADALSQIAKGKEPRPTEEALNSREKASVRGDPAAGSALAQKVRRESRESPASPSPGSGIQRPKRPAPSRPAPSEPSPQPQQPQPTPPAQQQPSPPSPSPPSPSPVPSPGPPPIVTPPQLHLPPDFCQQLPPNAQNNPLCP